MSSKYEQTNHVVVKPWKAAAPVRYATCQYMPAEIYPQRCGEPSHGRTYCEACRQKTLTAGPKFHGGLRTNRSEAA